MLCFGWFHVGGDQIQVLKHLILGLFHDGKLDHSFLKKNKFIFKYLKRILGIEITHSDLLKKRLMLPYVIPSRIFVIIIFFGRNGTSQFEGKCYHFWITVFRLPGLGQEVGEDFLRHVSEFNVYNSFKYYNVLENPGGWSSNVIQSEFEVLFWSKLSTINTVMTVKWGLSPQMWQTGCVFFSIRAIVMGFFTGIAFPVGILDKV